MITPDRESPTYPCNRPPLTPDADAAFEVPDEEQKVCKVWWHYHWGSRSNDFEADQASRGAYPTLSSGSRRGDSVCGLAGEAIVKKI